ncbi:AraC family transcriptional regulator [Bacteroides helcogenes]|uniref:Transcriptional regulator, AraC family n=1 Tax=Bacteroides helcogenes (strain ATCC 35417 / DSM 20613 / JCM 6297 / CCUG 15421 / P 36-108) TaxID=693979 RepID=E6SMY7_BACT6|nr:AraC family transcriptional regulator [Bacteroides helcogenes]ADV42703.1 transcriptional regulator, AraC family [Bacteroides helcogenes P 36-108]MDY5239534.1 AraC family transcriptional regulator [Bacteroides helcogenes]
MSQSDKHSFFFNSVHLTPEEQIGQHEQSTWELSYILVGSGVRLIGGTKEPFQSGEVVLIPPGIPHCWCFGNNVTDTRGRIANITVTFGTDFLDNCATVFPELCGHIEELKKKSDAVKFGKGKAAVIAGILENMRDLDDSGRVAPMINLLLLLAGNGMESVVGRHQKIDKEKNRLNQIQVYVVCNVKRDITLDDVARHVGMNRASFCVFFKKVTGKTFVTYLNEYRVEMACRLLKLKKMSVSEICYQVGFNNVPYFNRVFKRLKGISPGEYAVSS